jgi:ABC-2 type transport system permease protein/lipopolysaccharide transport system permease protein
MSVIESIPDSPPPELRFRRRISVLESVRDLWQAREFIFALFERSLRARYKQAFLGFAWAIIPPLIFMVVLSVFVQHAVTIPTGGVPYPLFSYVALVPWNFFSSAVAAGGTSIVTSLDVMNKMYVPREVFPISTIMSNGVDALISVVGLGILFVVYAFVPKPTTVWVPLLFVIQIIFTLGIVFILSALVVYLRDLRYAMSLIIQVGLFATPILYGMDQVPPHLRLIYCLVNPLAPVIDGYRRVVIFGLNPEWSLLLPAAAMSVTYLVLGFRIFKRLETGFSDIA